MLNGRIPTQMDLEKLEDRASRNPMKFSKEKCKVLRLGWNNSLLGSWQRPRGRSSNIHIQVESELTASSVFNTNHVFGYIRRSVASSWREALIPCAQHWEAHTLIMLPVWVPGSCQDAEEGSGDGCQDGQELGHVTVRRCQGRWAGAGEEGSLDHMEGQW